MSGVLLLLWLSAINFSTKGESITSCKRTWTKVGCFQDRLEPNRTLPFELVNHRDETNPSNDGHFVDWHDYSNSLHALACECNELSKARGYKYFGLQFYGECWSGPIDNFSPYGTSDNCIGVDYENCLNSAESECVGGEVTNYVYAVEEETCETKLEIGVILDSSSSVTRVNWDKTLHFVYNFSKQFDVDLDGTHFGVIHFAWKPILDFKITDERYWLHGWLESRLKRIQYLYGGSRIDLALKLAEKELFCANCGLRSNVSKILLVVTDGKSSEGSLPMTESTKYLKENLKVNIIAVGIGHQIDADELNQIASNSNNVFMLDAYTDLGKNIDSILKPISKIACTFKK